MKVLSTKILPTSITNKFPEMECIPFLEIQLLEENFGTSKMDANSNQNYILTSKNAIPFIEKRNLKGNFYVVGNSTKDALQKIGKNVSICSTNAEELFDFLKNNEEVFYFLSGNRVTVAFHEKLPNCIQIQVYKTVLKPIELHKSYDVIFFFSPSAVISYTSLQKIPNKTTIFALGNTTAKAISRIGNYHVIIPKEPTLSSLLETYETWKKA